MTTSNDVRARRGRATSVSEPGSPRVSARPEHRRGQIVQLPDVVVLLSAVGVLGYAWYLGRGLSFYADDWNFVVGPIHLLRPHFGHLSLVPKVLFHSVLVVFGLRSYAPYRAMAAACLLLLFGSLYLYLRARIPIWFAAFLTVGLIWFSRSDLFPTLFVVMVNYTIPLATMIGIWAMLDRRTTRADWVASGLMAIGLASSAVGVIAIVAVATELAFVRAPVRRWLRFGPPVLLWALWYAWYHPSLQRSSVGHVINFALHEFYFTFGAFVGGSNIGGIILAVLLAAGIAYVAWLHWGRFRGRSQPARAEQEDARARLATLVPDLRVVRPTARAASALVAAVAFAVATAVSRQTLFGQVLGPNVARYLWVIGIFLVVAFADCCRSVRFGPLVALVALAGLIVNGVVMADHLDTQRARRLDYQATIQPLLAATQTLGARSPNRILPISVVTVLASEYNSTVRRHGAPPGTTGQPHGREATKLIADSWMAVEVSVAEVPPGLPTSGCRALPLSGTQVVAGGTTILVRSGASPVVVRLRRYAAGFYKPPFATLPAGSARVIRFPRDSSAVPWKVQLSPSVATEFECPS
jgi:hypothetical protein